MPREMTNNGAAGIRNRNCRSLRLRRIDPAALMFGSWLALVASSPVAAQGSVMLRLHPRIGDTLRTVLEQTTEVSVPNGHSVSSSTSIFSESIVRGVLGSSTIVYAVVDSVRMKSTDDHAQKIIGDARRALEGQRLVLQIGADGTVESARDSHGVKLAPNVADAVASMPAVFPKHAVQVGEEWVRELPLPSRGGVGSTGGGRARATFRLDSLQHGGSVAYVSMHGEIAADSANGMRLNGTIAGTMQLDRTRGWMTDSRFFVMLLSTVSQPASAALPPMRFTTRVMQRMRTLAAP